MFAEAMVDIRVEHEAVDATVHPEVYLDSRRLCTQRSSPVAE